MSLWREIKNSVSSREYYRELVGKPFSHSLKYYCAITLLFGIIVTIVGSAILVPAVNNLLWGARGAVLSTYPSELKLTIEGGEVKTNVSEPYYIKLPTFLENLLGKTKSLLVIDTSATNSPKSFESYESFAVLTKTQLLYHDEIDGNFKEQNLPTNTSMTVTRQNLTNLFDRIEPYFKFVTPIIVLGLFMLVVLFMIAGMVYLLLVALLVWLLARANHWELSYLKAYQLSLHFATLAFLVYWGTVLIFPGLSVWILFTLVLLVVAYLVMRNEPDEKVEG
jgi:hypothetical protein